MSKIHRPSGPKDLRGHSMELWDDAILEQLKDRAYGIHGVDDFTSFDGWTDTRLNQSGTDSTAATVNGFGGILAIDCGNTTAHDGHQIQRGHGHVKVANDTDLFFEALIKITLNAPEPFFFVGHAVQGSAVLNGSSVLNVNGIGFSVNNADGHVDFVARDSSEDRNEVLSVPLTADEWYHLGFHVHRGKPAIPFINGVAYPSAKIPNANLPDDLLTPTLAITGQGTVQPVMQVDWVEWACRDQSAVR